MSITCEVDLPAAGMKRRERGGEGEGKRRRGEKDGGRGRREGKDIGRGRREGERRKEGVGAERGKGRGRGKERRGRAERGRGSKEKEIETRSTQYACIVFPYTWKCPQSLSTTRSLSYWSAVKMHSNEFHVEALPQLSNERDKYA